MEAEDGNGLAEGATEGRILDAMRARVRNFKEQADSITLENVRRIIEKDLGMEPYTLDVHKRFIKQSLEKCLQDDDEAVSEDSTENPSMKKDTKDKMKQKDHDAKHDEVSNIVNGDEDELNESIITKALKKRAAYFRKNSEKLSLVEVRRILEVDLELKKNALDPFKKFISQQLDEVFQPPEKKKTTNLPKNRSVKVNESKKADISDGSEDSLSSSISRSEDDEIDEPKEKSKKRISHGKKKEKAKKLKKSEDDEHTTEMAEPSSSDEDTVKRKKPTPAPAYGKRVEHLKSVIKSCGLGVPPSVYRRVKQAPERDRESFLIKELEEILKREGLSTNPSEKEINAVRRKKEKAKELEGIDLSNIVSSTRRRSTSFVVPPKPEILSESEEEEEENGEEDEEEDEEEENEGDDDMGEEDEEDDKDNDSEEEEEDGDEDEDSE